MVQCKYICGRTVPVSCSLFGNSGILDPECFHILFIESGSIWLNINGTRCFANNGSVLCLSKPFRFEILRTTNDLEAMHFSFAPEYVHFDLNWETILSPDYRGKCEQFRYPAFDIFLQHNELFVGIITLDSNSFSRLLSSYDSIKNQIETQPDEWWVCRSRLFTLRIFRILNTFREGIMAVPQTDPLFLRIQLYITGHIREKLTVDTVCKQLAINRAKLHALFRQYSELSFSKYVDKLRLDMVCENLAAGDLKLIEIMENSGFYEYSNFASFFKNKMGLTPSQYRKMAKNERNRIREGCKSSRQLNI